MSFKIAVTVLATSLALFPNAASACSCVVPNLARDWHVYSDTFQVKVGASHTVNGNTYYDAEVLHPFSGCTQPGDHVTIGTPATGPACGMVLQPGTVYLLTSDARPALGAFWVTLCGNNLPWSQVSESDRSFLESRPITCDGQHTCADGSPPVACLADPCSVATCDSSDRCEPNECGGCTAEFYDARGEPTCTPW